MSLQLLLLSAHLIGDFVFQTDLMAENKMGDLKTRTVHVIVYSVPFIIVVLWYFSLGTTIIFVSLNATIHWIIDTRRWDIYLPWDGPDWYSLMVDQTLHITTIAILSTVLL